MSSRVLASSVHITLIAQQNHAAGHGKIQL